MDEETLGVNVMSFLDCCRLGVPLNDTTPCSSLLCCRRSPWLRDITECFQQRPLVTATSFWSGRSNNRFYYIIDHRPELFSALEREADILPLDLYIEAIALQRAESTADHPVYINIRPPRINKNNVAELGVLASLERV
jgi:hypothetical protein